MSVRPDPVAPAAPEPLTVPVLDSHTHLDLQQTPVAEVLTVAREVGVTRVIQVGCDLESSRWSLEAAQKYAPVSATVALHPNEAPLLGASLATALTEIEELAGAAGVVGVGETGLDYFRTGEDGRAAQQESFRAHIAIAKRHNKALMIHDREAHADVFRVLAEEGAPKTVIFHCFSGDAAMAKQCADAGYYTSFAGNVTFKNAQNLRDAAAIVPPELLLVETDGPFLTPVPHRGKPNAPYLIPIIVRFLAELRGADLDELCGTIWSNGERAFGHAG